MGAREKLNLASITGILVIAGFMGLFFDSWGAFILIAAIGIAVALNNGELRPWPIHALQTHNGHSARRRFNNRN